MVILHMTTAQESNNGHHLSPLPCSFPDSQQQNQSKDSTDNNSPLAQSGNGVVERQKDVDITSLLAHEKVTGPFPASAYHVPPELYAPKADSFRDTIPDGLSTMKMPDRCQFMFSDGRQCKMARSDIHPSLCPYHSEREEQLFGAPHTRSSVRGPSFDLPELFSASRDLTTAAGVNRALGQVFRLLAQRRISRQEAATFGKLAHLLLQSIRAAHAEADVAPAESLAADFGLAEHEQATNAVVERQKGVPITPLLPHNEVLSPVNSSGESHGHQELSPVNKVQRERNAQTVSAAANSPAPPLPPASSPAPLPGRTAANNSAEMNTSAASIGNSREINTSENAGLNPLQNEHLQEVRRERPSHESHGNQELSCGQKVHQELRGVNKVAAIL
jgi:hypothetical protein